MAEAHSSLAVARESMEGTPEESVVPSVDLTSLDLGSGPCPAPGYVGLDLCGEGDFVPGAPPVLYCDLVSGERWPVIDGSVTRLRSSHFIEHIPRERIFTGNARRVKRSLRSPGTGKPIITSWTTVKETQDAFFWFFDQAYRVAAPGCRFELSWPHPDCDDANQDPTHARLIPATALNYLSKEGRRTLSVSQYPVSCDWRVVPGTLFELALDERLAPFTREDGSVDIGAAKRARNVFHEIRVILEKA